jgi:hypothetical protein
MSTESGTPREVYLGDGVTARDDGIRVELSAQRGPRVDRIRLGAGELGRLIGFATSLGLIP